MGVDHIGGQVGLRQEIQKLWRELRRVAKATLQNGSIGRAGLRVYDGGWIRIEGGGLSVTGTQTVSGRLEGSGVFDWTGPMNLQGAQTITGPTTFTGQMTVNGPWKLVGNGQITGDVSLDGDLSLGSGRFLAGPLIIDKAGGYGARVYSTGTLLLDASSNVVLGSNAQALGTFHSIGNLSTNANVNALGDISAVGDVIGDNKYFRITHPSNPDKLLMHGSLEGPEHGVYYRGLVEFDSVGEAVFDLPDYFVDLVLPDDVPTVQVTAVGRPFLTGAELVENGRVTVYGDPGREAHVIVTAARGHFDVEPDKPEDQ